MSMKAIHTAQEIADYLLWRVAQEQPEDPDYLTNMKLQKLLYYIQGWSMVDTGQPAFREEIEAWTHGPVVPSVFQAFDHLGKRPIVDVPQSPPELTEQIQQLIESVWQRYKAYSAFELSHMTHQEAPWQKARGSSRADQASRRRIKREDIAAEMQDQLQRARARLNERSKQVQSGARLATKRTAPWVYTPKAEADPH